MPEKGVLRFGPYLLEGSLDNKLIKKCPSAETPNDQLWSWANQNSRTLVLAQISGNFQLGSLRVQTFCSAPEPAKIKYVGKSVRGL